MAMMTNRLRVMDSLLRKIKISRTRFYRGSGCWEWQAVKTNGGYGHIHVGGPVKKLAHRVSYELFIGHIPEGLTIDHLCRNRGCCNPRHLEPVTHRENMRRSPLAGKVVGQIWRAKQAAKTQCPKGHPYSGDNLLMDGGSRKCRTCRRQRDKDRYPKRYQRKT